MTDVTHSDIVEGLHRLGLRKGNGVVVHSALSSFGQVHGGADTVIDALMTVITASGTILMPSFNHDVPFRPGGPGVYDPAVTPTSNGAIPDTFWRRPNVQRSLNPTHPFAAWGKHAIRYTKDHHRTLTMGPMSPLGLLWQDNGFGLLLGTGYRTNTFHHVVEMSKEAPCLGQRTEAYPVRLSDGRVVEGRTWGWRAGSCPFTDEQRYVAMMENSGLQTETEIGNCRAILYRLRDCYDIVANILGSGLDDLPPCTQCPIRPRVTPRTVESDWQPDVNELSSDSVAWKY